MTSYSAYHLELFDDPAREANRLALQTNSTGDSERQALLAAGFGEAERVLELGCGPNLMTPRIAAWAPRSVIVAVDYDANALEAGAERRAALGGRVTAHCADAHHVPVADGWADAAYLRFLLQHVPDPVVVLRETMRCLAPGGLLCVLDSDFGGFIVHPEPPSLPEVLQRNEAMHRSRGGDRRAARKLISHMLQAGLTDVRGRPITATTDELGREMWRELFLEPVLDGADADLSARARAEFSAWTQEPGAYGMRFGVLATGRVPRRV